MMTITRLAHAKINLTLDVGARREDGYHEIRSIMQTVTLHDTLTVKRTPERPGVRLEVVGEEAEGVPADESNLVHRAAVRLQKVAAAQAVVAGNASGLHVTLHKRIPSQAGLGGGSSDAAACLLVVRDLLGLSLSPSRLAEIASSLGADVPFFLRGGTALVEGLGERVAPLPGLTPPWYLVIVKPPVGVSTAAAYTALDAQSDRTPGRATEAWLGGGRDVGNDFERVVFPLTPEVAASYALLSQTNGAGECFRPLLCGSGSCLFRRVADARDAERMADVLKNAGVGKVWTTTTIGAEFGG